jgi:Ca2+-dependent lipid-binding protein
LQTTENLLPNSKSSVSFAQALLSGAPIDAAIGIIKVTAHGARSIGANKIGGGTPDPYVTFSINIRTQLAETKYKEST